MLVGNDIDRLLDFLRIDSSKIDLQKVNVDFDERGIELVELVYVDKKTKRLNRCVIGVNGVNTPNVRIPSTAGLD